MIELLSWLFSIMLAFDAALAITRYVFNIVRVKGRSMLDTLQNGDRLYVSILSAMIRGYCRGDVVICRYPGRRDLCVKRVIGLPGETVRVDKGQVYINGEALSEPYITHHAAYSCPEITLQVGQYFLLGDNRPASHDSHSRDVGPVTRMKGKARAIIWPIKRIGKMKNLT